MFGPIKTRTRFTLRLGTQRFVVILRFGYGREKTQPVFIEKARRDLWYCLAISRQTKLSVPFFWSFKTKLKNFFFSTILCPAPWEIDSLIYNWFNSDWSTPLVVHYKLCQWSFNEYECFRKVIFFFPTFPIDLRVGISKFRRDTQQPGDPTVRN